MTVEGIKSLSSTARKDKTAAGAAHLKAETVYEAELDFNPDNTPVRHANITGWPADKSDQMEAARELANSAEIEKYR